MNSTYQQQTPFWFKQALSEVAMPEMPALGKNIKADVCIVGGGYTGLWTAIKLKQQDPTLNIVIIEKGRCGQGASGRNGGCMLTFSTKFNTLMSLFGAQEAIRLVKASEQAVFDIASFCQRHNIDADVRTDGAIYTATNQAQKRSVAQPLALLEQYNVNRWKNCDPKTIANLTGSAKNIAGIETPAAGSLHPGKLVVGLVKQALALGISIFEHTPYLAMESGKPVKIKTPDAKITATKVVFAVNAWMGQHFKEFNRHIVLVSSDMLITKPIPEQLAEIGLTHGKAIADSRIFVHYYRTTEDGRLMLGKGGNLFSYKNKMLPAFDQPSQFSGMLKTSFAAFFPTLKTSFETTWTGASDRSTTGVPFFGSLTPDNNVFYGLGYSGNGVVQSYLGGDILSSLVLELDNAWTRSAMAKGPLSTFPPEPIRYIGTQMVKHAILRKEQAEDKGQSPKWYAQQLAKFAAAAGKADK